jgi:VWFA-related protein
MKWLPALLIPALLQAQTATLSGLIQDAAQSPIAAASVMLLQMETGAERTVRSNREGVYSVAALAPGRYKVTVEAEGFQAKAVESVELAASQNARLDFALVSGATPSRPPDFSSEVSVVSLLATVRDRDGRIVRNLTRDDFELWDDDVPQQIQYFTFQSNMPLKVGLLVDTSRSETRRLEAERRAGFTFLDRLLRPDLDQAFVARFDERVAVLSRMTSSRDELSTALDQLHLPPGYGTLLYTAIRDSSENVMKKEEGRKALIVLTDGVDHFDRTPIAVAIEYAQRADSIVYPIRIFDALPFATPLGLVVWRGRLAKAKKDLERMALETGGEEFDVSKQNTVEEIYSRIEEALRNQYSIGYLPVPAGQPGKYHKIRLSAKNPRLTVRTRDGYYASEPATANPATKVRKD